MRIRSALVALIGTGLIAVAAVIAAKAWSSPPSVHSIGANEVLATGGSDTSGLVREMVSNNWAGYIDTTGGLTGISATWTIPTLTPPQSGSVAEWVGLGGVGDGSGLIQAGVMEQWVNGQIEATAVTENLPATAEPGQPVTPGMTVTASVVPSGSDQWTLTVRSGSTMLAKQTVTLSPAAARSVEQSADWIVEAPSTVYGRIVPLASFGQVEFQSATVQTSASSSVGLEQAGSPPTPVVMNSREGTAMQPGPIGTDGASFSVSESDQTNAVRPFERPYRFQQFPRGRGFRYRGW